MYAIIETGGKQEKVSVGDVLNVERLDKKKDVAFSQVLLVVDKDKVSVGDPFVKGAKVTAAILGQTRGPKSVSFKTRRRKSSRRTRGHRQELTRIKITEISH
jgi:large subunit ribosomal protein L21